MSYRAVLLDLGDTLWRIARPPEEVWQELLAEEGISLSLEEIRLAERPVMQEYGLPMLDAFDKTGVPNEQSVIDEFWRELDARVLRNLGVSVDLDAFVPKANPRFYQSGKLFPETRELLDWLRSNGYRIAMVSNGVNQHEIVRNHAIEDYFEVMIRSGHVGFCKPMPEIFHMALSELGVEPAQAVMVGDNWEADVAGAEGVGIKALYLDRSGEPSSNETVIKDLWGVARFLENHRLQQ